MVLMKKKTVYIPVIIVLFMIIIFATYGIQGVDVLPGGVKSDQYHYKCAYDGILKNIYFEKGYLFITALFYRLGFSYIQFKFIAVSVAAFLIAYSVKGFDVNYAYVLLLYFFSSFSSDLEQSRNFFAMSLVIFAMHYLYDRSDDLKSIVKFCVVILLAATIHTAALFFLILVFSKIKRGDVVFDLLYPLMVFNSVICKIVINDIPELRIFIEHLSLLITKNERVLIFLEKTTGMGFYACVILQGMLLFLFYHYREIIWHKCPDGERKTGFLRTVYRCLQLLSLAIPFYIFSTEYIRMFRSLFIVFFVALLKCAKEADNELGHRQSTINVGLSLMLFVFMFVYVFDPICITVAYYNAVMML